jgi:hypothetical protein
MLMAALLFATCTLCIVSQNVGAQKQPVEQIFATYPLINEVLRLYQVDQYFVLQVFYEDGKLSGIRVAPKYEYEGKPQWMIDKLDILTQEEYYKLLCNIQKEKPLGKLVQAGMLGTSSNNITEYLDRYEYGVCYFAETDDNSDKEIKKSYPGFRISYYRKVSGKLMDKLKQGDPGIEYEYRVNINGRWYWTTEDEYSKCRINNKVSIELAAPIPRGI